MTLTYSDGQSSTKEIMPPKFGPKHRIIEIEGAHLYGHVDENTNELYVHLDLFDRDNWGQELYERMLEAWAAIQKTLREEYGHRLMKTLNYPDNEENRKFLNLFGFVNTGHQLILNNGMRVDVMKVEF